MADAYANNPITFSSLDDNYDGTGEWGGVIVQGFAPQYGQGGTGACFADGEAWCNVLGEGGDFVQEYGGSNPADDSGIIRYVRIAEGGLIAGPNNEINGLTLQMEHLLITFKCTAIKMMVLSGSVEQQM